MAEQSSEGVNLSRRQAMAAVGAGVVAVGGAAALAGLGATNWAKQDAALQAQTQAQAQAEAVQALEKKNADMQQQLADVQRQLTAAHVQIEIYKDLVGLFDTLDKIGLESVIGAALGAYETTLHGLAGGVDALKAGIVSAQDALNNFEGTFASIRNALTEAEKALANLGALLKNAQDLIANVSSPVLPFLDQARKFFDDLLGKIPFGGGESARQTINGIVGLIAGVPATLTELESGLFRTLREGWFSEDAARTIETNLSKPIINGVLEPLHSFLEQVDTTVNAWEAQVTQPVNHALSQREIVQKQIVEYRKQNSV